MRYRLAVLVIVLAATIAATPAAKAPPQSGAAGQEKLPPLSYVCPMKGDEEILEDKPGSCPKCKMTLVPVRLDAKFSCPVHSTQEVKDGPGKCRFDGRELVPVTLSVFWTCPGDETHLMEPGACASGQPRRVGYEVRAHGDHNPRHGGQFFMAQDAWHHLEGTLPRSNVFRMFFYDNFTKPLPVKNFQARIITREEWDPIERKTKELEVYPLEAGREGSAMEARMKNATLPLKVAAIVKFDAKSPEQRFDFNFTDLSKEPPPVPAATTTSARPAASGTTAQNTTAAPAAATPSPAALPPAPVAPQQPSPAQTSPVEQPPPAAPGTPAEFINAPLALTSALDESGLPTATPDLLAELTKRSQEVEQMVNEGSLGQVWLPAMGTKTVALALEAHMAALPERQRAAAILAVKRVVTAAWELDAYGDLGNKLKMSGAYLRLASAVADLKAAYAGSR
jgi:heavy metal-binding protein